MLEAAADGEHMDDDFLDSDLNDSGDASGDCDGKGD